MSDFLENYKVAWTAWLILGLALAWVTARIARRTRSHRLARLIHNEKGAAYTLSYVMTVPLYLLMVIFFIELSMMLIAKIGTVYSAFGAARTAIVWDSAAAQGEAQEKARQSAVQTMAPFAAGLTQLHLESAGRGGVADDREEIFLEAFDEHSGSNSQVARRYVQAKYRYAARALDDISVEIEKKGGEDWNEDVVVRLTYDYPLLFPVLGRILMMERKDGIFIHPIRSTIRLQCETPKNPERRLGISYASP